MFRNINQDLIHRAPCVPGGLNDEISGYRFELQIVSTKSFKAPHASVYLYDSVLPLADTSLVPISAADTSTLFNEAVVCFLLGCETHSLR